MLIDVYAHFHTERSGRADWKAVNARRLRAGARIGITAHVASILGSWGHRSPIYFPSPDDVVHANDRMLDLQRTSPGTLFGYCVVNPNYTEHALREIDRRFQQGMIGIKLAASRRADDPLLDPIAELAGERGVPILHHGRARRRPTRSSSVASLRVIPVPGSSWRTSVGEASGRIPFVRCATCTTSGSICRGAAWTSTCSSGWWRSWAASVWYGAPISP